MAGVLGILRVKTAAESLPMAPIFCSRGRIPAAGLGTKYFGLDLFRQIAPLLPLPAGD